MLSVASGFIGGAAASLVFGSDGALASCARLSHVRNEADARDVISVEGPRRLVFGFKAIRLSFERGQYRAFSFERDGKRWFSASSGQQGPQPTYEIVDPAFARIEPVA